MTTETETTELVVWTWGYFPFSVGGAPRRPIKATLPVEGPHDLGGGFTGYVVTCPSGESYVAEASSGALVGPSLEEVRADITGGDRIAMSEQIAQAQETRDRSTAMSADEFMRYIEKGLRHAE